MTARSGVPHDRVVAVEATLAGGGVRIGSGYLISATTVLTAAHCVGDAEDPPRAVSALRVIAPGGASAAVDLADVVREPALDVAVLRVVDPPWASAGDWSPPRWARIDRSASGSVPDCEAVGHPWWQEDGNDGRLRGLAEVRGAARHLEDLTSRRGFLVLRDPWLSDVGGAGHTRSAEDRTWRGLSGALVFSRGAAIGVIVEHDPRQGGAAIRVLPVDRIAQARSAAAEQIAARLALPPLERFPWAFPDELGALRRAREDLADAAVAHLRGRGPELERLAGLGGPGPPRRLWVRGPSFAGKTALLATFAAADPPARTTVASCLLSRSRGRISARYLLDGLTRQLAAIAWHQGYVPPPDEWGLLHALRELLPAAAAACADRGEHLLVVVDGLDEYDADAVVELGLWLPAELPPGASLLVSSRPDLPGLPRDHPLHDSVLDLAGHEGAGGGADLARAELRSALRAERTTRSVLAHLAVVGGGLTTTELDELLDPRVGADEIDRVLGTALGRTLTRGPGDDDPPWEFAHDHYAVAARELLDGPPAGRARAAVDRWADRHLAAGWPASTPRFLLSGYVPHLRRRVAAAADPSERHAAVDRLCAVVAAPGRWTAVLLRHRTPVAAEAEIAESQNAVRSALDDGVLDRSEAELAWARLGLARRRGNRGLVTHVAGGVAGVWALDGDTDAALEFASALLEPDGRAEALGAVAAAVGVGGARSRLDAVVEQVLSAARSAGPYADDVRGRVALLLGRVGRFTEARTVSRSIGHTEDRVACLADLGLVAARAGRADTARSLARSVVEAAARPGFSRPYRPLGSAAEVLARTGDHEAAAALLDRADALTSSGWGEHEIKYRWWAETVVATARWRCTVLRVTDAAAGRDAAAHPDLRPLLDGRSSYGLTALVHAVGAAAVLAERGHVDTAGALALSAVRDALERWFGSIDPGEARFVGAGPLTVAESLLDAGLVDPVLAFVDHPVSADGRVFGQPWRQSTRDAIGLALVRALTRAGRHEQATDRLRRIESDDLRLRAEGDAVLDGLLDEALRRDGGPAPAAVRRARRRVDDLLVRAAERDAERRRSALRARIEARAAPAAGVDPARLSAAELLEEVRKWEQVLARAQLGTTADDGSSVDAAVMLARGVGYLAAVDRAAAAPFAPGVEQRARSLLAEVTPDRPGFEARCDAVAAAATALAALGEAGAARSLATALLTRLEQVVTPTTDAVLAGSGLGRAVRALTAAGALSDAAVDVVRSVAWSTRGTRTWSWASAETARLIAPSTRGEPRLARLAADLLLDDPGRGPEDALHWRRAALDVLARLVEHRHDEPAARSARALLRWAQDPDVGWAERGVVLGGLVRVGEATTRDEAVRGLLLSPELDEYAEHLPPELLRTVRT